jgi:aldehyde dehydrogenase (NAD+)
MTTPATATAVDFEPETRLYIDGQLRESSTRNTIDNINPATEELLGVCTDASAEDMEAAIGAARRAFDCTDWATDHEFRRHCLLQLHTALQDEQEAMRGELVAEVGTSLQMTFTAQLDWPLADAVRWPAEFITRFAWQRMLDQDDKAGTLCDRAVVKEPMGVVGAITPWNYPFEIISHKLGQILATGNTVVLKPAVETPWSALRWGRIIAEKTDIPAGVVNIVPASDNLVAQRLLTDERIDMISFTGSTAVGQLIQQLSASTMKRNLLELGGKSALLFLDDADLDATLPLCLGALMNSGQGCANPTRILVPRALYNDVVERVTDLFAAVTVGDPTDPATFCGPLVSAKQHRRVLDYIASGVEQGARVTAGGGIPDGLHRGYFVAPTVFADVQPDHRIFQEEIFGPVVAITAYDGGDDEAVTMTNNTRYGLATWVLGSHARAMAVGRRIRAGVVNINNGIGYGPDAPFGGYKMSGIGRQNGIEGFEQYLQTKTIGYPAL